MKAKPSGKCDGSVPSELSLRTFFRINLPISDYMGERTAAALVREATRSMPSYNKRIKSEKELEKLIAKVFKTSFIDLTCSLLN